MKCQSHTMQVHDQIACECKLEKTSKLLDISELVQAKYGCALPHASIWLTTSYWSLHMVVCVDSQKPLALILLLLLMLLLPWLQLLDHIVHECPYPQNPGPHAQ